MGAAAPRGWLYGEADDADSGSEMLLHVCSMGCARSFWRPGPGKLHASDEEAAKLGCAEDVVAAFSALLAGDDDATHRVTDPGQEER